MNIFTRSGLAAMTAAIALSGCSYFEDDEEILPGERIPVRATSDDRALSPGEAARFGAVSPAQALGEWTQVGGNALHAPGHIQAPTSLSVAWRADLGAGGALTATPVVAGGKVFGLDAAAQVTAFSSGGAVAWRADLSPEGESADDGFGGGLAWEAGRLFVTTGFGEVVAMDADSGEVIWRQQMTAPVRAAPAVANGIVIAVARDNTVLAFGAADGSVKWRVSGSAAGNAALLGGASPAISPGGVAILPFASGELIAVRANSGQRLWSDVLTGGRRGLARASISDITSDPVIQGVAVIAGNQSGRLVAIDGRSGRRGWTREFGSQSPVWADGATLFVMSDAGELKRLSSQDGATIWSKTLPEYSDPDDREDAIAYGGPVLAGGRLLMTSSEGVLHSFDPVSGEEQASVKVAGLTGLPPVVAGGTVYVVTANGGLVALR